MNKTVYHTTKKGNGKLIEQNGWEVNYYGTNIFGRGIYFWESLDDAHSYGVERFGKNNYDIVSEVIPIRHNNSVEWDYRRARDSHIDQIAKGLKARGIHLIVIPNPAIESSTMAKAKGKAYVWLVDMSRDLERVRNQE